MPADRLLDWPQLQELGVRYTRQHLWRLEHASRFPQRVQLGPNRVAWWESEVLEFLRSRARGPVPQRPHLAAKDPPEPDAEDVELLRRLAAKHGLDLVPRKPERRRSGRSPCSRRAAPGVAPRRTAHGFGNNGATPNSESDATSPDLTALAIEAQQLPALIDRATRCLAEARTSAEVLEAKAIAEAALHFAKVTRAANDTQANCLRMIVRAEMRMADEIDRGQAGGEVAKAGDNPIVRASDNQVASYDALGIDRRRVAEWRAVRDAGPAIVERVITHTLAEDRAPTKADIYRAIDGQYSLRVMGSSESPEWYTPAPIVERVVATLGEIDLDPSWHPESPVRACETYTPAEDGLAQRWAGRVFLNPPYGRAIDAWVAKLVAEYESGDVTEAVALVPARVDTEWFRRLDPFPRCFVYGRITFDNAEHPAPFPSAVVYLGADLDRFVAAFGPVGSIFVRLGAEVDL